MRRLYPIVWAFLFLTTALSAQINVSGTVLLGTDDGTSIPEWPVAILALDGDQLASTVTTEQGEYVVDVVIPAGVGTIAIQTVDLCTGDVLEELRDIDPDQQNYVADFIICNGINPPPPPECEAFFYYEQLPSDEGFLVHFYDLSHIEDEGNVTWSWDFGDGATSEEQNPQHTYTEPGEYVVTLTITAGDDCTSTIVQLVLVYNESDCDCPTDEYDPVCVITASGSIIEFTSACFAECAGFSPDQYFSCDGGECSCPEFYAPVCVIGPDGEIIEFPNHCFAECEGYGPDQWMECESDCECPEDEYNPVCVYNPFGTVIQFDNACLAECAGYLPGQYQPCDGGCVCPEFYDPVCVILDDRTVLIFDNFCFAQCEGYGPEQWEECENDCECPEDIFDPVCVATPSGIILTFINPCEAECAGYGPDIYYHCDDECVCPEYLDPVCVITADGEVLTFDNPCFAECEGYGPDQYFPCDGGCAVEIAHDQIDDYTFQFSAVGGTDPAVTYLWDFGDGNTSEEASPLHTYAETPAVYFVQLTTVDADGCLATAVTIVFAGPDCYAIIIALPLEENPFSIAFGAIASGNVVSWAWDFGDGNTSNEGAPVHTYNEAGVYLVTLTIATEDGCTYTVVQEITVEEGPCTCPAVWDPVCVAIAGQVITFPNACFAICEGFTEEDFLDECEGECVCTDEWDPVCVLTASGEIITFGNPCEAGCFGYGPDDFVSCEPDCACDDIFAPVCVLDPASGEIITFENSCFAECAGFGPDQFVDCDSECDCPAVWEPVCVALAGQVITFPNACVAECEGFSPEDFVECEPGCVCPDIWDPVCVATASGEIVTFPNACVAECEGFTEGDFVDCPECVCDDFYLPVCVFDPVTGVFLTFINPCEAACAGYGADEIFPCDIEDDCYADFTFVIFDDTEEGYNVQFTDASFAVDGITSWFWDFGDGNTSTEQNPFHTYFEEGVFDVTLTIESEECGTVSTTYHICIGDGGGIGGPTCQAFFFFEQPNPDDLLTYQFIDFSLGVASAWLWDFGDGNTSSEQNPVHTYELEGTYQVSLTIFSEDCESTVQIGLQAGENVWYGDLSCRAWFLPIINPGTFEVYFINLSSADAVEFLWDFGDGTTSTDPLALHTYSEPGTYTATLTTTNEEGCTNTFSVEITLNGEEDGFQSNPVFSLVNDTEEVLTVTPSLQVAPNPTDANTMISWESSVPVDGQWSLIDMNGRVLQQQFVRTPAGLQQVEIDMQKLPAGIYLFRVQTEQSQYSVRISKL
ncbi:MAG: PKD domain-containing protein [Bacteroidota bacterium]